MKLGQLSAAKKGLLPALINDYLSGNKKASHPAEVL